MGSKTARFILRRPRTTPLVAWLAASILAPVCFAAEPVDAVHRHFRTLYQGRVIGVLSEKETVADRNGRPVRVVESTERVRLATSGALVERRIERRRVEALDGNLHSYREIRIEGAQRTELKVVRTGTKLVFTRSLFHGGELLSASAPTHVPIPFPFTVPVLFELDGKALARAGRLKLGSELTAYVVALEDQAIARVRAEVIGRRRVKTSGGVAQALLVQINNAGARAEEPFWQLLVTPDGELIEIDLGPGLVRRRVSAKQARLPRKPAVIHGRIRTGARLQRPETIERLRIVIAIEQRDIPGLAPDLAAATAYHQLYAHQPADASDKMALPVTLLATWPDGRLPRSDTDNFTPKQRARYLAPTLHVQSAAPPITSLAKKIRAGERSEMKTAYALTRWVYRRLKKLSLGPSQGSALEALRARAGDCTEHAALLGALARACGIPSRTVSGLVHENGAFQFHAWNELYLSGRWVPVDSSLGRFGLPALYLRFGGDPARESKASQRPAWALALLASGSIQVLDNKR